MTSREDAVVVRLVAKPKSELVAWFEETWVDYAEDLARAGFTPEEVEQNIARNTAALFVDGLPNDEQRVFDVLHGDVVVGSLWLAERREASAGEWYIYDIVVDEEFRGQGYGRATMTAAEEYVRAQGGTKLGLNVFGFNTVARSLYESMGYVAMTIGMRKDLA